MINFIVDTIHLHNYMVQKKKSGTLPRLSIGNTKERLII
jgi:hypothetical protein